jgi:hypothetical protein
MGVYLKAIEKIQSPFEIFTLSDGDQRILVTIQQTHTIGWQSKFFDYLRRKVAPPLSNAIQ